MLDRFASAVLLMAQPSFTFPFERSPMTMRRYVLRDDQWQRIEHLLLGRVGTAWLTAKNNRLFVEAVLYRY